ncbi:MAG: AAA family ATPase [Bacilli bacterium]|jgi:guanylate kinase|nr:AAA family ATPase [Bacilli bacterium]MCH4236222.1 AAA family ATPase [Bacilli bacterium]
MIILVGASASGKTEVAKTLAKKYGIRKIITHTTRDMRKGEQNGVDYYFVSKPDFLTLKEQNAFAETTLYNGNFYGTSKKEIGDNKVLLVDPNGLNAFKKLNNPRIVTFFLFAESPTRRRRMLERGDDPKIIEERLTNDLIKFAPENVGPTNYVIDSENQNVEEVADCIYSLYQKHLVHLEHNK